MIDDVVKLNDESRKLAERIVTEFTSAEVMIATAESCTGGLIAGMITEISGSSSVLDRGFVTYSNDAKMEMLGVAEATLETHGAVSKQTASEMALGALKRSKAHYAVSVTGIAGPGGGLADKPVGLVWMGLASPSGGIETTRLLWDPIWSRELIRAATVHAALGALLDRLAENSG